MGTGSVGAGSGSAGWVARLAQVVPSTRTAGAVAGLDPDALSDEGLVDGLVAVERHRRMFEELGVRILAAMAQRAQGGGELAVRAVGAEVACALRLAESTAAGRVADAVALCGRHPASLDLLKRGEIHYMQALAVLEVAAPLDVSVARLVEARVLPRMPEQTVGATRKALHRAVVAVDPHGAQVRHEAQREQRRVMLRPEYEGMATVELYTTAHLGAGIMAVIDRHAKNPALDDRRTLDQRRADTLADLILGGAGVPGNGTSQTSEVPALVKVTVGLDTLLGIDDAPGELAGYGPVTAQTARALACTEGSIWRRLITDPGTGALVKTDPTTYRPTAEVRRHVEARDRICAFPSCRMPAERCDLDHVVPFDHDRPEAGGPTTPENLIPLCRAHHRAKTAGTWQVTRDTDSEQLTWTSPTGKRYTTDHAYDYRAAA
jgi:hypothetical protein